MPMETRSSSALFKRAEQLRRWQESETNQECSELPKEKPRRIKFSDGCVFLAACAAGDKEEVERLLAQGADINTANVDGLTALHQACIDDNLDMVEFLVEHECDLNRGDNEGWTPLHATSSCGFVSIARFLIESGANVASVNNDGDLPIDIGESGQIEQLLQKEINRLGIDCDAVRMQEETQMLEDANQWLNTGYLSESLHPKTGASALHVAAAKGYIKVISLLVQAGVDLNAQDNDGWTPLHAGAHWGQKEACQILAENLANMDIKNFSGQTCFDVCDPDHVKLLEELKNKQASMQRERPEIQAILQRPCKAPPPLKRRTSVTRMSGADKTSQGMKDTILERAQIEATLRLDEEEEEDRVTERKPAVVPEDTAAAAAATVETGDLNNAVLNKIYTLQRLQEAIPSEAAPKQPAPERPVAALVPKQGSVEEKASRRTVPSEKEPSPTKSSDLEVTPVSRVAPASSDKPKEDGKVHNEKPVIAKLKTERENSDDVLTDESSSTPTDESLNGQAKRMFLPPIRDEESEAQRKAHAKRVRETRRSTQGVTLEDLKSAEQQLLRKQQEEDEQRERESDLAKPKTPVTTTTTAISATLATTTTTASSIVSNSSTASPVTTTPSVTTPVASKGNVTIPTVTAAAVTAAPPVAATSVAPSSVVSPERRISWRTRSEEILKTKEEPKEVAKEEPVVLRRFQELNHVPASVSTNQTNTVPSSSTTSVNSTTTSTASRIRQRPVSAPAESPTVAPPAAPAGTAPLRARIKTEPQPQLDNVGENEDMDKDGDNKSGSALQRRRRPKRRSTGVVYIDGEENPEAKLDSVESTQSNEKEEEKVPERPRNRFISSSSLQDGRASDRSRTASLNSSTSSLNEEADLDYKKLYFDMKDENERLKKKLGKMDIELESNKQELQRLQRNMRNSLNDGDKRERRALERKLSELEEEVKNLAKVKAENEKLKAENRALTRVVSNFSK